MNTRMDQSGDTPASAPAIVPLDATRASLDHVHRHLLPRPADRPAHRRRPPHSRESELALAPKGDTATQRERWTIWRAQLASGSEPCFATEKRFLCGDDGCVWRSHCLRLRAEWLR